MGDDDSELVIVSFKMPRRIRDLIDFQARSEHRNRSDQLRRYALQGLERDGRLGRATVKAVHET